MPRKKEKQETKLFDVITYAEIINASNRLHVWLKKKYSSERKTADAWEAIFKENNIQ